MKFLLLLGIASASVLSAANDYSFEILPATYTATQLSKDGLTVLGRREESDGSTTRDFVALWRKGTGWQTVIEGIQLGPDPELMMSHDGTTVAGNMSPLNIFGSTGFRWTASDGLKPLPLKPYDISANGRSLLGLATNRDAVIWNPETGNYSIPELQGRKVMAIWLSADGNVAAGRIGEPSEGPPLGNWMWSKSLGFKEILDEGVWDHELTDLAENGSCSVGIIDYSRVTNEPLPPNGVLRFSFGGGKEYVSNGAPTHFSDAQVSDNGAVMYYSNWRYANGIWQEIPMQTKAISADGNLHTGLDLAGSVEARRAAIWSPERGFAKIGQILQSHDVPGAENVIFTTAFAVSADGQTILGNAIVNGQLRNYIATVPRHPRASNDSYVIPSGGRAIAAPGVLANDSFASSTTVQLVSGPAHGTLSLAANGGFTYRPASAYLGPDSFTYESTKSDLTSNVATVTLNVVLGIASLTVGSPSVTGGYSTKGMVKLTHAAPQAGTIIKVWTNSSVLTADPAQYTIPGGSAFGGFMVNTVPVAVDANRQVFATAGGYPETQRIVSVLVQAPRIKDFWLKNTTVVGGTGTAGNLILTGRSPSVGTYVAVTDNSSVVDTPTSFKVPAGHSSGSFPIGTKPVSATYTRTVTVSLNGTSRTAQLTLTPSQAAG